MALRDKQRVIYTSPIKALSNQKYRELNNVHLFHKLQFYLIRIKLKEFGDVGLITGDVSINQNASCLVMTTEIFRSMLYRGSEIIREVAWVIFDEVHYMRDKERGVVWEETIILTSPNIKYVFLSATIPNAREFAEWICSIKKQVCHVVYTDLRPVPLQHYLFPNGGEGVYLVVDETGKFREENFNKALAVLGEGVDMSLGDKRKKKKPTEGADLFKLVKMIMEKKFDPVIIFSFSKKEVEGYAMAMTKLDLTTEEEKENIAKVYESAMDCLAEEDKNLPQVSQSNNSY